MYHHQTTICNFDYKVCHVILYGRARAHTHTHVLVHAQFNRHVFPENPAYTNFVFIGDNRSTITYILLHSVNCRSVLQGSNRRKHLQLLHADLRLSEH